MVGNRASIGTDTAHITSSVFSRRPGTTSDVWRNGSDKCQSMLLVSSAAFTSTTYAGRLFVCHWLETDPATSRSAISARAGPREQKKRPVGSRIRRASDKWHLGVSFSHVESRRPVVSHFCVFAVGAYREWWGDARGGEGREGKGRKLRLCDREVPSSIFSETGRPELCVGRPRNEIYETQESSLG